MKLTSSTKVSDIQRDWHHVDLKEQILGRVATGIALQLMGKKKPYYVSYLDCGDYVVVTNAATVIVTGKKEEQKTYQQYSGYPGGLKEKTMRKVREENPERIIREAVSGMLPKNKMRASMMKRLYIFHDDKHPYAAKLKK